MKNTRIELYLAAYTRLFKDDDASPLDLPGSLRLKLVKNMRLLRQAAKDISEVRNKLITATIPEGQDAIGADDPGFEELQKQVQDLMESDSELELAEVSLEDLNPDKNPLSLSLIDMWLETKES